MSWKRSNGFMEIVKTMCPRCFKVFEVSEELDKVECVFCKYIYDLPKLVARVTDNEKVNKL